MEAQFIAKFFRSVFQLHELEKVANTIENKIARKVV